MMTIAIVCRNTVGSPRTSCAARAMTRPANWKSRAKARTHGIHEYEKRSGSFDESDRYGPQKTNVMLAKHAAAAEENVGVRDDEQQHHPGDGCYAFHAESAASRYWISYSLR